MASHKTLFRGYNARQKPTDFTSEWYNDATDIPSIAFNDSAEGDKFFEFPGANTVQETNYSVDKMGTVTSGNREQTHILYELSSVSDDDIGPRIHHRITGDNSNRGSLFCYHNGYNGGTLGIGRFISNGFSAIASATGVGHLADTKYNVRFETDGTGTGTTIKAKIWLDTESEPGTWDIDTTVGSGNVVDGPGKMGIGSFEGHNNGIVRYHAASWGDEEDAPALTEDAITTGVGGWQNFIEWDINSGMIPGTGAFDEFEGVLLTNAFDDNLDQITSGHANVITEADIKMTDGNNLPIPFKVARFDLNADPALSKVVILYKTINTSKTADTAIRLHYDYDGTAPTLDADDEFGPENAHGSAIHRLLLQEDPNSGAADAIIDQTRYARHRTADTTMSLADLVELLQGIRGLEFDGTDDWIGTSTGYDLPSATFMWESLIRFDDPTGRNAFTSQHSSGGTNKNVFLSGSSGNLELGLDGVFDNTGVFLPRDKKLHHFALLVQDTGSTSDYQIYLDGVKIVDDSHTRDAIRTTLEKFSEFQEFDGSSESDFFEGASSHVTWFDGKSDQDEAVARYKMFFFNDRFHSVNIGVSRTHFTDFGSPDVVDEWPAEFSQRFRRQEDALVKADAGVVGGNKIEIAATNVDSTEHFLASRTMGENELGQQTEVLCRFKCVTADAENGIRLFVRGSLFDVGADAVVAFIDPDGGGRVGFFKWVGGTFSFIGTAVNKTFSADTWYWFRAQVTGSGATAIPKAKFWSGLVTDEPASWDYNDAGTTTVGDTIDIGECGIGKYGGSPNTTDVDFVSFGYGATAPSPGAGDVPVIDSATPSEGSAGTEVVLAGENFTGTTAVSFNGTAAVTFTVDSDSQITVTVPTGATTGTISATNAEGTGVSLFSFTVLPTIPADGWNIELLQIQVNSGETDIEQVPGSYRQYYTEGLVDDLGFIPISISNLEESVEWDEGVFRLGSVDMTVAKLEADYFNNYRNYVSSPFILLIRDANDNILFHGPVDPETCNYDGKSRHTTIRALSWEVLLEGTSAPCRSIFETTFSRDYSDAIATGINSTMYVKKTINGTDMTTVVVAGSVLVFDTPAGEHRSIVLGHTVDGDDLAVLVNTEPTVYLATNKTILGSEHEVFQVGSGGLAFRRLRMTFQDSQIWENLNAAEDGVSDLVLTIDVNGKNYTMPLTDAIDTSAAWYNLDEDRITVEILLNICSGTCDPITLETDFIDFGSTISITSNTKVSAGDAVRILGAEMYGYNNTGPAFAPILHFQINGGVLQGMFSLSDLGVLPYIIDTFVFPSGFDKRVDRWAELPPNLLDALHQIQNTHGLLLRITPTIGTGGLPRGTVTIRDRGDANSTDSPVVSTITNIIEWNEIASDLTPTAVVVKAHINYFEPVGRIEDVGFYFDGLDLLDPQTTGKPQNGRVVEITVNTTPSYTGDIFFGDGVPVRNDDKLKEIAKKFYEYYRSLSRPCQFKIEGTPQQDLLTKILDIDEIDDPLSGTTFSRTVFCEGVITDLNTNQTVIRGRIGEFTGLAGQNPIPVITGQLIYTDTDDSGDETVILSGLNSYDPQGDELTYEWKEGATSLSTSPVLEHTLTVGDHTITLEVTDADSNVASTNVTVQVKDASEDLPDGDPIQANFVVQSYSLNQDGDLFITVTGDGNTKTTDGIVYRTADTQAGLDTASDNEVDNPQVALEIISAIETNETKWVRVSLINVIDDSTSTNVWEFSVTNTGATTALIIPSNTAPTSSSDTTGVDGELRADGSYLYYKDSTNGWIRAALSTF